MTEETKAVPEEEMEKKEDGESPAEETLKNEPENSEPEKEGQGEPEAGQNEPEEKVPEAAEETEAAEAEKDPLAEAQAKAAELTDRVQRQMAEFENFRKRTEKEKAAMFDMGSRNVIEKILPVIDNFERGLGSVPAEAKEDPFVVGMDAVYRQLMKTLEELGVKVIEAKGQPFNPELHNAVMHIEDDAIDENIVVEEFQKGYTYHDSVVRYSMVKVAN